VAFFIDKPHRQPYFYVMKPSQVLLAEFFFFFFSNSSPFRFSATTSFPPPPLEAGRVFSSRICLVCLFRFGKWFPSLSRFLTSTCGRNHPPIPSLLGGQRPCHLLQPPLRCLPSLSGPRLKNLFPLQLLPCFSGVIFSPSRSTPFSFRFYIGRL